MTKKRGSKFGALLWHHLTPKSKSATQLHNYNPSCIQMREKDFGRLTSSMTSDAHNLVHSEPFLDHRCEIWHFLSALCSDVREKSYIVAHLQSQPWTTVVDFFQNPQLFIRSGAHKLFRWFFCIFAIFDSNFAKVVAPSSNKNENYVMHLKEQSFRKKALQTASKSDNKRQRNACSNYAPLERTVLLTRSMTKNQTPYFRTYSRRAFSDLPQILHGDRARRAHNNRCDLFFDPTHSFSYRVHGKIRPNWPTRGFSAITP